MSQKKTLKQYNNEEGVEVGLDEAGRGCLFGPVCVAGVIWPKEDPDPSIVIKDSKKLKGMIISRNDMKEEHKYYRMLLHCWCQNAHIVKVMKQAVEEIKKDYREDSFIFLFTECDYHDIYSCK